MESGSTIIDGIVVPEGMTLRTFVIDGDESEEDEEYVPKPPTDRAIYKLPYNVCFSTILRTFSIIP
jgi:hypothetical protein